MEAIIINDIETARHHANIAAKAARLWAEGYTYKPFDNAPNLFFVFPPDPEKTGYIVDTAAGYCSCPGFKGAGVCSHLVAMTDEVEFINRVNEMEDAYTAPVDACH